MVSSPSLAPATCQLAFSSTQGQNGPPFLWMKYKGYKISWEPPLVPDMQTKLAEWKQAEDSCKRGCVSQSTEGQGNCPLQFCLVEESLFFLNLGTVAEAAVQKCLCQPQHTSGSLGGIECFCSGKLHSTHQQSVKATESLYIP